MGRMGGKAGFCGIRWERAGYWRNVGEKRLCGMEGAGGGGARCVSRESEYVVEQERMSLNAGHSLRFFMGECLTRLTRRK